MNLKLLAVAASILIALVPSVAASSGGDETQPCTTAEGYVLYANCMAGYEVSWACKLIFGPAACDSL